MEYGVQDQKEDAEERANEIESAISKLVQHRDHLRLSDYGQVLWNGLPAKKAIGLISVTLAMFATIGLGGWKLGKYLGNDVPITSQVPPDSVVRLTGAVQSEEGQPLQNYKIANIEQEYGPFTDTFEISVRARDTYTLLVKPEHGTFPVGIWYSETADDANSLGVLSGFPDSSATVHGKVLNLPTNGAEVIVEIDGVTGEVRSDGNYRVINIPLGNKVIVLKDKASGDTIFTETINLEFSGATPYDIPIP